MSKKIHLTLATGDYESIRALKEGSVKPDGIELTVLTDMTSDIRHWRMIRNQEFDIEFSDGQIHRLTVCGDSRFPSPPFSPRFCLSQRSKGYYQTHGLNGQKGGFAQLSGHRQFVDPRYLRA